MRARIYNRPLIPNDVTTPVLLVLDSLTAAERDQVCVFVFVCDACIVCVYVCVCVYACVSVYIQIHICLNAYKHTYIRT